MLEFINETYIDKNKLETYLTSHDFVSADIFLAISTSKVIAGTWDFYIKSNLFDSMPKKMFVNYMPVIFWFEENSYKSMTKNYFSQYVFSGSNCSYTLEEMINNYLILLSFSLTMEEITSMSYQISYSKPKALNKYANYLTINKKGNYNFPLKPDSFVYYYNKVLKLSGEVSSLYAVKETHRDCETISFEGRLPYHNHKICLKEAGIKIYGADVALDSLDGFSIQKININLTSKTIISVAQKIGNKVETHLLYVGSDYISYDFSKLKKYRLYNCITQAKMASLIGISLAQYKRIEREENIPKADILVKIMVCLGINDYKSFMKQKIPDSIMINLKFDQSSKLEVE